MTAPQSEPDYKKVQERTDEFKIIFKTLYTDPKPGLIERILVIKDFLDLCAKDHPWVPYPNVSQGIAPMGDPETDPENLVDDE